MSQYQSPERRPEANSLVTHTPVADIPSYLQENGPRMIDGGTDLGMQALRAAAASRDPEACAAALDALMTSGIAPETIVDDLVPRLARDMGEAWCEDEMSFAEVTIGTARLQAMVRELGARWGSDRFEAADAPTLLLAVPHDVHHTLGAVVLTGQLRRRGCSVRLVLGATGEDIARHVTRAHFDAVLISSSRGTSLETLRDLVSVVRQAAPVAPRIVIGGTVLETQEDVCALTGADHVSNDPDVALGLCGLAGAPRDTVLSAQEH